MMDFSKKPLNIFFSYYKPHIRLFIADMLCAFCMAAIDVAFPMFSRYALNTLIPNHQLKTFLTLVGILLIGFCIHKMCNWFVAYWGHVFGNRVEQDMRRDVFDHLEELPFSFYDTNRTGKIMSRATTDLFEITELAPRDYDLILTGDLGEVGSKSLYDLLLLEDIDIRNRHNDCGLIFLSEIDSFFIIKGDI